MQYIGRINKEMFKYISEKIITQDVILTEKQRNHIKERHPMVLEKYEKYFKEVIEIPDYILKDNTRENTALLIKSIKRKDKNENIIGIVNLVLRLAVEEDYKNNKNSIITCIPIGKHRLQSYKNNGKIIYKRE